MSEVPLYTSDMSRGNALTLHIPANACLGGGGGASHAECCTSNYVLLLLYYSRA